MDQNEWITPTTITNVQALKEAIEEIAKQRFSVDPEEFIPGVISLAVPVTDADDRTRIAISIPAPSAPMSVDDAVSKLPHPRNAAAGMRHLM